MESLLLITHLYIRIHGIQISDYLPEILTRQIKGVSCLTSKSFISPCSNTAQSNM